MMRPILFVHGLFGHLRVPQVLLPFAKHDIEIHTPDLIGYGMFTEQPTNNLVLADQAEHIVNYIQTHNLGPVNLVGHSVGGAVSVLIAGKRPDFVASLTSVEGNFTLKDAFWSEQISRMPLSEVEKILTDYKADADNWLTGSGVEITDWTSALARAWLDNQPASTIQAEARAVVQATDDPEYLEIIKELMISDLPFGLIAGENSAAGWDVPKWVREMATQDIVIPDTGHLMMLQDPEAFAQAVLDCCR
ncbi:alpha/beta hydrolase [Kiloniella laminariae]|uniref:Alpha/beta hydrolase n=1 Tax=Kiloniella laminariae TaxID=454162 RepID=A0ABT4LDM3_9PROT|nr:alpha/beta hydrolase [Kiloniella laminariae]MCZ4279200.1 alpha/beta hydrolase [Kiloniella laminariae]